MMNLIYLIILVPDSATMAAMLKREQKLRQSPSCQRAISLPLSSRHEINRQVRLRVVREFNLPDTVADLLEVSTSYCIIHTYNIWIYFYSLKYSTCTYHKILLYNLQYLHERFLHSVFVNETFVIFSPYSAKNGHSDTRQKPIFLVFYAADVYAHCTLLLSWHTCVCVCVRLR